MASADDELIAYEDDPFEPQADAANGSEAAEREKGSYVGMHVSGFRDFVLKPELLRAIVDAGWEHPSAVQQKAIPQALLGQDVLCQGKSGLGKTAVFVLSILQQLDFTQDATLAVVMCNTRELAYQIAEEFERFKKYFTEPTPRVAVFFGGVSVEQHRQMLAKETPHIVVGTPGRLSQLAQEGHLKLNNVKHFVVDECDEMLGEISMRKQVQEVFRLTPHRKQVIMCSATLPKPIQPVLKKFMQDPVEIYIDNDTELKLDGLKQYKVELKEEEKNRKLVDLLDQLEFNQVVIFVNRAVRARELNQLLEDISFPSLAIYGGRGKGLVMSQEERIKRYKMFKDFEKRILVSTELFARGIDIERVNIVINYDMPREAPEYLHRIGRAGRFGTKGLAISFVSNDEDKKILSEVEQRYGVSIPELPDQIDVNSYMNA